MTSTPEQDLSASGYLLGSDEPELARLDSQAAALAPSTRLLLRAAGIRSGMRVLDLGTGLGHVAFELAQLVGDAGEIVGIDQSRAHLAAADARRSAAGLDTVRFVEADVRSYQEDEPFDAVVARLLLFHVADPLAVLRHHVAALSAGGRVVALDFDAGACRSDPPVELAESRRDWIVEVFRRAGANPTIGARLPLLLREAGLADVESLGVQEYLVPGDPAAGAFLADLMRSLAPQIVAAGIAGEAELDLDGYERRVARALMEAGSVFLPPTLSGAWGVRG
jgi:SAM-dependent methyltransferase